MQFLRCYPKITDWLFEITNHGIDLRFLPFYSYGFMVASAFLVASIIVTIEFKRRENEGLFDYTEKEETIGTPPSILDTITSFIMGFLLGFKVGGFFSYKDLLSQDPAAYLLSMKGNWIIGLLLGGGLAANYWWDKKKKQLAEPTTVLRKVYPSDKVGDMVGIAALFGILGAAFFNYLEDPGAYVGFWSSPLSYLFSGLSVFGGMICAGAALFIYATKNKIAKLPMFDTLAMGFILAVGIGRIGCQVSGDADWGIANLAPKPAYVPQFLWADTYAHNIANEGVMIENCKEDYCKVLPQPVFPTPLYELLQCTTIFLILWGLRKRFTNRPGLIFMLFAILTGIQRYTIEQFRAVSSRDLYAIFGGNFKQAELISIAMFVLGIIGFVYLFLYYKKQNITA